MANPFLQNLRILVGKLEDAPGTPETLDDVDFDVRIRAPELTPVIEPDDEAQKYATGDHGEDESIMGAQSANINFHTKMAWGGDVETQPKWWKFMQSCGAVVTDYPTTGMSLEPQKANDNKTMTIEVYDIQQGATPAAYRYRFAGCMGNATLGCEGIGMPWIVNYSFTGKLVDFDDVTNPNILALTSPDTTVAERLLNNPVTIGGVTQKISSFELDLGNQISPVINQAQTTGYDYFAISERRPRFSMNPLIQPVATEDILAKWTGETTAEIGINTGQSPTHFTLTIPVAQILNAAVANREGLVNWDQNFKCLRNGSANGTISAESTWELLIGAQ